MADTTTDIVRRTGFWETINVHAGRRWLGMGTMVAMAQGTGPMDEQVVRKATRLLFQRHELLRCRLDDAPLFTSFIADLRPEDIPVDVRHVDDESGVIETFEQLLHEELPDRRRLWGVLFAPSTDGSCWRLFLKMHHCVADGRSIGLLIDQFVSTSAALLRGVEPHLEPIGVQPAAEARVIDPMCVQEWQALMAERPEERPITPCPVDHEAPDIGGRRCRMAFRALEPELAGALHTRSHELGTTVLGALAGAAAVVHARHMGGVVDTDSLIPVDMRRFYETPPHQDELGMAAYIVRVFLPGVDPLDDPWELAVRFRELLTTALGRASLPPFDFGEDELEVSAQEWTDHDGVYRHGWCLTNVGVTPWTGDHPPLTTDRVEMSAEVHMGGCPMIVPMLSHKGVLRINFTWIEPLMEDATAAGWIEDFWRIVHDMIPDQVAVAELRRPVDPRG